MFLIAGLGNIGENYSLTRHNVGFMVIDEITKTQQHLTNISNSNFNSTLQKSNELLFSKPTTYMNNSGVAIRAIRDYYKIDNENIIIIHDDLDLPFGAIKFKIAGGHGGHNGLKSVDSHIGNNYIRVRIGVGKPQIKEEVVNYVLSSFSKDELNQLKGIITHSIEAINSIINGADIESVKREFNKK